MTPVSREPRRPGRRFANRAAAGEELAHALSARICRTTTIVLALPRGGVPVAAPIADLLGVPLDVFIVRKVGHPQHAEYGIGSVTETGFVYDASTAETGIDAAAFRELAAKERNQVERRIELYRNGRELKLEGQHVLVVDDGLATGVTARAAGEALRQARVASVCLAVPVAPQATVAALSPFFDSVTSVATPGEFFAVGLWYDDFEQLHDEEVITLLSRARMREDRAHLARV